VEFLVHGIGRTAYGERDYWPDGSFITTEWFVVAWIPFIPICSKRISYTQSSDYAVYDPGGDYYVIKTMGVDRKQSLFIYLWCAAALLPLILLNSLGDVVAQLAGNQQRATGLCLAALAVILAFPYFIRRWAKRGRVKRWKRQSLRLDG